MNEDVIKDVLSRHGNNGLKTEDAIKILNNLVRHEIEELDKSKLQIKILKEENKEFNNEISKLKKLLNLISETIKAMDVKL